MRNLCAVLVSAALVSTSAFAASSTQGLLAPAKPAGVTQAQNGSQVVGVVAGTAVLAMLAALISGGGGGGTGGSTNPNGITGGTPTTTTSSSKAATSST